MKNIFLSLLLIILISIPQFPLENIDLKDGVDYLEKLTNNEVYFSLLRDMEYNNGVLYLLDSKYCKVFMVDFKSAKLKKTLFRKGQGPYELMIPMALKVKNNKVFILDQGYNGIKIVNINGSSVSEFKTVSTVGRRNFDVNQKDEIFVGEYNTNNKTYVSVYNLKGKKLRSIIKLDSDKKLDLQRIHYQIMLDNEDNILLLFPALRELKKFNPKGGLIWEIKIKNRLLDKCRNDDGIKVTDKGAINARLLIFDMCIFKNNNIVIGHAYGGSIYNENGILTTVLELKPEGMIFMVEIINNKILNSFFAGREMTIYNIKEKKNVFLFTVLVFVLGFLIFNSFRLPMLAAGSAICSDYQCTCSCYGNNCWCWAEYNCCECSCDPYSYQLCMNGLNPYPEPN